MMKYEHLLLGILTILIIWLALTRPSVPCTGNRVTPFEEESYQYLHAKGQQRQMLPVNSPFLNARIIVKQLLLLQDHLEVPGMFCLECIAKKHMPTIEAYAEESISLIRNEYIQQDPRYQELYKDMQTLVFDIRELQVYLMQNPEGHRAIVGRAIRVIRKNMSAKYGILSDVI